MVLLSVKTDWAREFLNYLKNGTVANLSQQIYYYFKKIIIRFDIPVQGVILY
jgi:hypothetical protein